MSHHDPGSASSGSPTSSPGTAARGLGAFWRYLPEVVLVGFALYFHLVLWSHFRAAGFAWYDLTMISDWLSNAMYRGRPFYMSDREAYHLAYNFTPSLLLLAPLFRIFQSQYLVLLLNVVSLSFSVWLVLSCWRRLAEATVPSWASGTLGALLVVIAFENRFTKTVLLSGHFEIYYAIPMSVVVFLLIRQEAFAPRTTLALLLCGLIACGVRQDAGLYLSMHSLGLLFVPGMRLNRSRLVLCLALAVLGVLSAVLSVAVFMPALGDRAGLRLWSHLGSNPYEIAVRLLLEPTILRDALMFSGFRILNGSFGLLHLLSPYTFFANAPVLPLYLTHVSDIGHRNLGLYNASFALPGFFFATAFGMHAAPYFVRRARPWLRHAVLALLLLYALGLSQGLLRDRRKIYGVNPRNDDTAFRVLEQNTLAQLEPLLARAEDECPSPRTVASDDNTVTLLPNRYVKLLLPRAREADLIVFGSPTLGPGLPDLPPGQFQKLPETGPFLILCKSGRLRKR